MHEGLKAASRLALQGKSEDALVAFRRLLEEAPGSFEVQRDLAEALARLRRYPEAAAAYKEAMRLSPRLAGSVALSLGRVELEMGQRKEAAAIARAALEEDPARAHLLMARVAMARGDLTEAEGQARLAMADAETESEGAMTLADVLGRLGRFAEAQAVLEEQIRAFPRRAQTYASLAVMLALQGRPRTEVYGVLESMAKANPGRETIFLGAKTLDFVGDKDAATVWRRRAASPGKPVP